MGDARGNEGIVGPACAAAVVDFDLAFVADEARETGAVPSRFVGLEVEGVVFGSKVGDAFFAGGSVAAFEGGDLGAGGVSVGGDRGGGRGGE